MQAPEVVPFAKKEDAVQFIERYSFFENGRYILGGDHDRFFNHQEAARANTFMLPSGDIAAKTDIRKGEELTADYSEFDQKMTDKF